ncbi:MAG: hypothetical protein KGJ23_08800 [Euryarchaeota archaeon]|nr:hypothetical protein [Euryarchaeota archaeon]MDE1880269.1 hypothetical protein [Euryarchaeota archaeon]MDE2044672.1 hypothetical protein [Thermoplasmata archaeon]
MPKPTKFIDQVTGREMVPATASGGVGDVWVEAENMAKDGVHPSVDWWFEHVPEYCERPKHRGLSVFVALDQRPPRHLVLIEPECRGGDDLETEPGCGMDYPLPIEVES